MVRFTTMLMLVGLVLLFGVIIGINTAEEGISRVEGLPDGQPKAFAIQSEHGQVDVAVLGKTYQSALPDKQSLQVIKNKQADSITLLGSLVNHVGTTIRDGARNGMSWLLERIS